MFTSASPVGPLLAARRGVTLDAGEVQFDTAATSRGRNVPRNMPALAGSTRTGADVLSALCSNFSSPLDTLDGPDAEAAVLTKRRCCVSDVEALAVLGETVPPLPLGPPIPG